MYNEQNGERNHYLGSRHSPYSSRYCLQVPQALLKVRLEATKTAAASSPRGCPGRQIRNVRMIPGARGGGVGGANVRTGHMILATELPAMISRWTRAPRLQVW